MSGRSILIQGASIAGPALAFWLARAGDKVTIVERAPAIRTGGYKIDVRGSAVSVLDRMGLYERVAEVHVGMRRASFVGPKGRRLATLDGDMFGMRNGRDIEVMRGDLAHILYDTTREIVHYRFNDSVAALEDRADGVSVRFASGVARTFDFVVAADGIHSSIRHMVFGEEARFARHLGHYISVFSVPNRLSLSHEEIACPLPGRLVNLYSNDAAGDAKAMFFFASPPLDVPHGDVKHQQNLLQHHMLAGLPANECWILPQLFEDMRGSSDFYFDSISQIVMTQWTRGRIALVGDAAWCASPASGQGVSLALVGAYVLARELGAVPDCVDAFIRYQSAMQGFVIANQQLASQFGTMLPHTSAGLWIQRQALRTLSWMPGKRLFIAPTRRRFQHASHAIDLGAA